MADDGAGAQPPGTVSRVRLLLVLVQTLFGYLLFLFVPAGTWLWPRGWIYFGVVVGSSHLALIYLNRVNPEVIVARMTRHQGTKPWDRVLLSFFFPAVLAIPIVSALDDGRLHWSGLPWWAVLLGYALMLIGIAGIT